jgi:hypothetical protein
MPPRPRISLSLVQKIRVAPHVPLRIIIRFNTKGPAEAAEDLKRRGFGVRYIQATANLVAAEARGETILTLAGETWVTAIEEDPGPAAAPKPPAAPVAPAAKRS